MSVSALDAQTQFRLESLERVTETDVNASVILTEKHYAFEGDVDNNPGAITLALLPPGSSGSDRFLNRDGQFSHSIPVQGKDRWERRRNIAKAIKAEARKHGLAASERNLDFDGVTETRFIFFRL